MGSPQNTISSRPDSERAAHPMSKHHGLIFVPRPSDDERDPLRWPRYLKLLALAVTAFLNFTANFAGSGLSVATPVLEAQFGRSQNDINGLLTVSNHMMCSEYKHFMERERLSN